MKSRSQGLLIHGFRGYLKLASVLTGVPLQLAPVFQLLVQKAMTAKGLSHAQGGCLLAGYLRILPLFLLVLPGLVARALYPGEAVIR